MRITASFVALIIGVISITAAGNGSSFGASASCEETSKLLLALGVPSLEKAIGGGARNPLLVPAVMCPGDMLPSDYTCCCETIFASGGRDRICMTPADCADKNKSTVYVSSTCLSEPYEGCY